MHTSRCASQAMKNGNCLSPRCSHVKQQASLQAHEEDAMWKKRHSEAKAQRLAKQIAPHKMADNTPAVSTPGVMHHGGCRAVQPQIATESSQQLPQMAHLAQALESLRAQQMPSGAHHLAPASIKQERGGTSGREHLVMNQQIKYCSSTT